MSCIYFFKVSPNDWAKVCSFNPKTNVFKEEQMFKVETDEFNKLK